MSRTYLAVCSFALALSAIMPGIVSAQTTQYSHIVITTQMASGASSPTIGTVIVTGNGPSLSSIPTDISRLTYAASFAGETRVVTTIPGTYSVVAQNVGNLYPSYSADCSGYTGQDPTLPRYCTITLSTTPPVSVYPCQYGYSYNGYSCVAPTPSIYPSTLSCAPNMQTVNAGQLATFTAVGGTTALFTWSTDDRTFVGLGSTFSFTPQTRGSQIVRVTSASQTAICTLNVRGSVGGWNDVSPTLPNTGFAPQTGAIVFAIVLLLGGAFMVYPYARRTLNAIFE